MNPIGVRGDPGVAVLGGPVLECEWSGGTWLSHFSCRREEWSWATPTDNPTVRTMPGRIYRLLLEDAVRDWWLKQPEVSTCRVRA
jgi:hypothetical protein